MGSRGGDGRTVDLAARRWARTADRIERAALELFATRGFEAVTVEEVAAAAEISHRTFYRYFATKESVLLRELERRTAQLQDALRERPPGEDLLTSLRIPFLSMAVAYQEDRDLVLRWAHIVAETPSLVQRALGFPALFLGAVTEIVADRLGADPRTDLRPGLVARTVLGATYHAYEVWLGEGAVRELPDLVEEALDLVEPGLLAMAAEQRSARRRHAR